MPSRLLVALLSCLVAVGLAVVDAQPAHASQRVTLARPSGTAETVLLRGAAPAGTKIRVVRKTASGWKRIATDRADGSGRYRLQVPRPTRRKWVVRAVSGDLRSVRRRVVPAPTDTPDTDVSTDLSGTTPPTPPAPPAPSDACGVQPLKADGTPWQCAMVDNFDGTAFDPTKWVPQETSFSGMRIGDGCFTNDPRNIEVGSGVLRLSAQRSATPFTCRSPYGDFTTQRSISALTTKGRFNQAYGRFEFRAKMPATRVAGAHSTLWLFPDQPTYGKWPLSGEIDVAEWYSAIPNQVYPSLHYADGLKNVQSGKDGIIKDVTTFHTYAVEWSPNVMRFYYDGKLTYEHRWTALAPLLGSQPFDKPFNVVLTQAWGQLWNAPTSATPDRVTMTVDWVKVWK